MDPVDKALENQLKNLQTRVGKTLVELGEILRSSGLSKHGELRDLLKRELGMGHGDANTLVHYFRSSGPEAQPASEPMGSDPADALYVGPKADLRPIHDSLMAAISRFGPFEISPKKTYLSLRRKKQFAMIGPATKTQVEVGLNAKGIPPTGRLKALPPGGMCQFSVRVATVKDVDDELIGWIKSAFESAG